MQFATNKIAIGHLFSGSEVYMEIAAFANVFIWGSGSLHIFINVCLSFNGCFKTHSQCLFVCFFKKS